MRRQLIPILAAVLIGGLAIANGLKSSGFYGGTVGTVITAPGFVSNSATYSGTKTLAAGAGTTTVATGARCVCTDTTAAAAVKCSVSGTTLTFAGTTTDVIAYFCF